MHLNLLAARKLILLVLSALVTGCASLFYDSNIPDGTPKGYVEFYGVGPHRIGDTTWSVYKAVGGKNKIVTSNKNFIDQGRKRKIAERPGLHTYLISLGSSQKLISVEVVEGMVRPIRITLDAGSQKSEYNTITYQFTMTVAQEDLQEHKDLDGNYRN